MNPHTDARKVGGSPLTIWLLAVGFALVTGFCFGLALNRCSCVLGGNYGPAPDDPADCRVHGGQVP